MDDLGVHLRPDPLLTAAWGAFGGVAVGIGVFLVVRSVDLLSVAFLVVSLVAAGYYVAQLVLPGMFRVDVDVEGIRGRWLWRSLQVPWPLVRRAAVRDVVGESVLQIQLESGQQFGLLLPVGADVAALHDTLASRLGE